MYGIWFFKQVVPMDDRPLLCVHGCTLGLFLIYPIFYSLRKSLWGDFSPTLFFFKIFSKPIFPNQRLCVQCKKRVV